LSDKKPKVMAIEPNIISIGITGILVYLDKNGDKKMINDKVMIIDISFSIIFLYFLQDVAIKKPLS
jgi:hypothetical protein